MRYEDRNSYGELVYYAVQLQGRSKTKKQIYARSNIICLLSCLFDILLLQVITDFKLKKFLLTVRTPRSTFFYEKLPVPSRSTELRNACNIRMLYFIIPSFFLPSSGVYNSSFSKVEFSDI